MPQFDRRRLCDVPIEFIAAEDFTDITRSDRVSLVLLTDGKIVVSLNGKIDTFISPCVFCLSERDTFEAIESKRQFAQSFRFYPEWLKNRLTFKLIKNGSVSTESQLKDLLELFYNRNSVYSGVLDLPPDAYIKIFEWMGIIGTEIAAQSDGRWTCRVRAYFLRILNLLDEIYSYKAEGAEPLKQGSDVDSVIEYLHTHYMDDITLETLCRQAHTNRTTLNRNFKERTGQTVIAYLLDYRLRVATELLAHTGLTIDEIASASGFIYGTYLIR